MSSEPKIKYMGYDLPNDDVVILPNFGVKISKNRMKIEGVDGTGVQSSYIFVDMFLSSMLAVNFERR